MVTGSTVLGTGNDPRSVGRRFDGSPSGVQQTFSPCRKWHDRMELVELVVLAGVGVVLQHAPDGLRPDNAAKESLIKVPIFSRL